MNDRREMLSVHVERAGRRSWRDQRDASATRKAHQ